MPTTVRGTDVLFNDNTTQGTAGFTGFRNRIINGDMRIAQRGTASVNTNATFPIDRFAQVMGTGVITSVQSAVAPSGFTNSFFSTVTAADTTLGPGAQYAIRQTIEGLNMADLDWGTANAQSVTISFWVRSSITGTYSLSLRNSATDRSYIATYVVNTANTMEYKTITVPGDTTGTWLRDNNVGVYLQWTLGGNTVYNGTAGAWSATNTFKTSGSVSWIGNNGATFYITGIQFEKGSVATPFEHRNFGVELSMCQRYYEKSYDQANVPATATIAGCIVGVPVASTIGSGGNPYGLGARFKVEKRTAPTITIYSNTGTAGSTSTGAALTTSAGANSAGVAGQCSSGFVLTTGLGSATITSNIAAFQFVATAEL